MKQHNQKTKFLVLMFLSVAILLGLSSTISHGPASAQQNKTLMQPQGVQSMAANTTKMNIVLVHGAWADASSWSKVIHKALHSRLGSCSTSTLLGGGHYD